MPETLEELYDIMLRASTHEELDYAEEQADLWIQKHPEDEPQIALGMEQVAMMRSALAYVVADSDSE